MVCGLPDLLHAWTLWRKGPPVEQTSANEVDVSLLQNAKELQELASAVTRPKVLAQYLVPRLARSSAKCFLSRSQTQTSAITAFFAVLTGVALYSFHSIPGPPDPTCNAESIRRIQQRDNPNWNPDWNLNSRATTHTRMLYV